MIEKVTIQPVKAAEPASLKPEFARTHDVELTRGIKRGSLYNLHSDGKIRGFLLRIRGRKSGVRLWDLASIDAFIRSQTNDTVTAASSSAQQSTCDGPVNNAPKH